MNRAYYLGWINNVNNILIYIKKILEFLLSTLSANSFLLISFSFFMVDTDYVAK